MVDKLTKKERSENMRRIKSKDMKPEMIVRKVTHSMGYRYRLHKKELPGKPDLVFTSIEKVIFVHGCFWHQHEAEKCKIKRVPKSNLSYWSAKLENNRIRDIKNNLLLEEKGWDTMTIWECETKESATLKKRIRNFLDRN